MTKVTIVGWHFPDAPIVCERCGKPATVLVEVTESPYGYLYNLCNDCLKRYEVVSDKIDEVFRKAGF